MVVVVVVGFLSRSLEFSVDHSVNAVGWAAMAPQDSVTLYDVTVLFSSARGFMTLN